MNEKAEHEWADLDWSECTARVRQAPHFLDMAVRAYPAYRLLWGDMLARTEEEFLYECARLIAVLIVNEAKPDLGDLDRTANNGGIQIVREASPLNWRIVLHGPFVNDMRMVLETKAMFDQALRTRQPS